MTACADSANTTSRIALLPVSPRANTCIRFAGPTRKETAIAPEQAVEALGRMLAEGAPLSGVEITGPGDPLATPEITLHALGLIRSAFPDTPLSLTTNGMGAAALAGPLSEAGLKQACLLVNAVDPEIAEHIYAWIRPGTRTLPLPEAARMLVKEQAAAVTALTAAGIRVSIRTTIFPETNDSHVNGIAATMAALGAEDMLLIPYTHDETDSPAMSSPTNELMDIIRSNASRHLPVLLGTEDGTNNGSAVSAPAAGFVAPTLPKPVAGKPNVALVSSNGMDVDMHLGQATNIMIYGPREDGLPCLLCVRKAPATGGGDTRWIQLAELLEDCFVLLAASAGEKPKDILRRHNLPVLLTEGEIGGTVNVLYGGGKKGKKAQAMPVRRP
ncbi:radical SAM protein [Desulfovibrio mangrovi]|uniref:NifB/NifX family molybdenum-iron cluster-binding protein n=1 Tax=Desulfovibrio mangrovi TaxID=2976983 RepID=UPI0022454628|nr:NifB/NifX family molybdenum-iron cluster-binding protein [Desulfovibrio mangrovi]UZP68758.1 radical SAM protein [Desulfovibrio mangrovi]